MNTSKLLEGRNHQQRSHQQVKPKCNKRAHTNGRKGNPDKETKETTPLSPTESLP